jgi:hypothetical protein
MRAPTTPGFERQIEPFASLNDFGFRDYGQLTQ